MNLQNQSSFPGRSSPAIGADGSVYLAIGTYLHCYLAPESSIGPDIGPPVMGEASRRRLGRRSSIPSKAACDRSSPAR